MTSENVCEQWRQNCTAMERHEQDCQAAVEKMMVGIDLPRNHYELKRFLENAFDRGACFGIRNFDAIASEFGSVRHAQEPSLTKAPTTKPPASEPISTLW